ncbi:hypothetical protein RRG08_049638 [Elysia crispata]|uniref:Uncharacterized protein n=1 Tax=Elysia crispata TaxID=231223 RepID=A0AAE1BC37_9GAST|nr:hypothetical protein RRG08_049638 [Elysia crispata]
MYNHTETGEALVYYRSQREFSVPVKQLGEGTHRFQAYIYPNVTGWESRVSSIPLDKTVILRPPQLSQSFTPPAVVDVIVGVSVHTQIEFYGFPEPTALLLQRMNTTNLTSSRRHVVSYAGKSPPFGLVRVTFSDTVMLDVANYSLTISNGVGDLVYSFFLNGVPADQAQDEHGDSFNMAALIIGIIAVVIISFLVVVILLLVRKSRDINQRLESRCKSTTLEPGKSRDINQRVESRCKSATLEPGKSRDINQRVESRCKSATLEPGKSRDKNQRVESRCKSATLEPVQSTPFFDSHTKPAVQSESGFNYETQVEASATTRGTDPAETRQYETIRDSPAANTTTASFSRQTRQYETIKYPPSANTTTASLSRQTRQYETIKYPPSANTTTASLSRQTRQYETIKYPQSAANTTTASLSRQTRQYETIKYPQSAANTTTASLFQEKSLYETLPDLVSTSGPFNSTSPQDVEPSNVYNPLDPDFSVGNLQTLSGSYSWARRNPRSQTLFISLSLHGYHS